MERRSELTELQIHIIDILSKVEHPHTFFKDARVTGECITNWTSGVRAPTDIVSIQDALKAVGYEVLVRRITEPTIGAVEVVRCKDCKWYNGRYCFNERSCFPKAPNADDYCSYGERKDNGKDL